MAKIAEMIGFVENWTKDNPQHPDWAMKVTEPHSKKDGDNWVTVARTYWTVKAGYEVEIDFTQFAKGDRVRIAGISTKEVYEKDGKTHENIVLKADSVEVLPAKGSAVSELKKLGAKPIDEAF